MKKENDFSGTSEITHIENNDYWSLENAFLTK